VFKGSVRKRPSSFQIEAMTSERGAITKSCGSMTS
jgi:hypothetical protein